MRKTTARRLALVPPILLALGCASGSSPAPRSATATPAAASPEVASDDAPGPMIRPARLKKGDTIMFVAPAGDLDHDRMMLAKQRLEERGYRVKMRDDLFAREGYLAGSDQRRRDELMQAFLDPEVNAVFPGTGGYGTMRILDKLDYEAIRANPKVLVGFSDITGLHLGISRRAGLVTFHTPSSMWGLGSEEGMTEFSERYLFQAIAVEGSGRKKDRHPEEGYVIQVPKEAPRPVALGKGKARGRLMGGNLSLISALEGTPYAIDTRDAILLIEDTREAPYRIDRMLRQLHLAGKLDTIRGAVVGQFTRNFSREDQETEDPRYSVDGVLRQYFEPLGIPVLMNFPVGHHPMNASLPIGGMVEVDAGKGVLRILADEER